jgi:hypothetical protein
LILMGVIVLQGLFQVCPFNSNCIYGITHPDCLLEGLLVDVSSRGVAGSTAHVDLIV